MSNRLFQGIVHQMRDSIDRVIGVVDETATHHFVQRFDPHRGDKRVSGPGFKRQPRHLCAGRVHLQALRLQVQAGSMRCL